MHPTTEQRSEPSNDTSNTLIRNSISSQDHEAAATIAADNSNSRPGTNPIPERPSSQQQSNDEVASLRDVYSPPKHSSRRPPTPQRGMSGSSVQFDMPPRTETPTPGTVHAATWESHASKASQATQASKASGFSTTSLDEKWAPQHVLCLDGGGVRGYSTLLILQRLMDIVAEFEKKHEHPAQSSYEPSKVSSLLIDEFGTSDEETREYNGVYLPCHYFDYMFGTSTGGLIAILLGRLRMDVHTALEKYETLAKPVFGHPRIFSLRGPIPWFNNKHNSKRFEKEIKDMVRSKRDVQEEQQKRDQQLREGITSTQRIRGTLFSQDLTFNSDPLMCRTVCVAYCNQNAIVQAPYLFRSYEHFPTGGVESVRERNAGPAHAIPIWKVARATTAAPSYFNRMEIDGAEFMDGAVGSNNPAVEAYWEVKFMHSFNDKCLGMFLSIGTGEKGIQPMPMGSFGKVKFLFKHLLNYGMETNSADDSLALTAKDKKFPYHRFNVHGGLGSEVKLDDWKAARLGNESTKDLIIRLTTEYLNEPSTTHELETVAAMLVKRRRERASTARWHIALGLRYRCTVDECINSQKTRNTRRDLRRHIDRVHPDLTEAEKEQHVKNGTLKRY